jgi:hypothetical protein
MMAEIALRFMGYFDGFGDSLDGFGELLQGLLDALEAGRNAAEKLLLWIGFRWDHG